MSRKKVSAPPDALSEADDIDFTAPLRQRQAQGHHHQTTKAPHSLPGLPAPLTGNSINIIKNKEDYSINTFNSLEGENAPPFTEIELTFLYYYIIEKQKKQTAMISAGYPKVHRSNLTRKANRIIYRYEVWAGQAQKVFRQAGLGEVRLALKIDKLLEAQSRTVQTRAAELLAKILRATAPPEVPVQGVKIIINLQQPPAAGDGQAVPLPPEVPGQPSDSRRRIPPPAKPLQITK